MGAGIGFDRDRLAAALAIVGVVKPWQLDPRAVYPTPGMVRVVASDGTATVSSSSLDAYIEADLRCESGLGGFIAPMTALTQLVSKSPAGAKITLEPSPTGTVFRAGRSRATLIGSEKDVLAARPAPTGSPDTVAIGALRAGIEAAAPATLDDMTRPYLGGIHLHSVAGQVVFAAQDGARIHASAQDGARIHASALIPRAAAAIILGALPDEGDAQIIVGERSLHVSTGGVRITVPLLVDPFPSIDAQMASLTSREFRARADVLLAELDLVMTVGNQRDRDFRLDLGPTCEASAFRVGEDGVCTGATGLSGEYVGAPFAIGFQFPLVRDALRLFGSDVIHWRMAGPLDASIITSPSHPGVEALVKPFMLAPDHLRRAA